MFTILILILLAIVASLEVIAIIDGNIDGVIAVTPLMIILCLLAILYPYQKNREKRQKALCEMYSLRKEGLPSYVADISLSAWSREFHKVIESAIESTSDDDKLSELQHCKNVVDRLCKPKYGSPFYKINNAFRLTGCHITITDSKGKTITKI